MMTIEEMLDELGLQKYMESSNESEGNYITAKSCREDFDGVKQQIIQYVTKLRNEKDLESNQRQMEEDLKKSFIKQCDELTIEKIKLQKENEELEQKVEKYKTVIRHAKMATDIDDDIKSVHPRVLKQINYSLTKALEEPR